MLMALVIAADTTAINYWTEGDQLQVYMFRYNERFSRI
jgi:hypothetical protein